MSNKKIVIIGGSGSIGFSIANEILREGFDPHFIGRNETNLKLII